MENIKQKLSLELLGGLLGQDSIFGKWELRPEESFVERQTLIEFLDTPSARHKLLDFLRKHNVPRELANNLLEAFEIPTAIPAGAMNILGLGQEKKGGILPFADHQEDGSPLDWSEVFWDSPGGSYDHWYWRRNDLPIVAVCLVNGNWIRQTATY